MSAALPGVSSLVWAVVGVVVLYAVAVAILALAGRRGDARALARFVPDCAIMVRRLAASPESSRAQRLALLALVLYLASPIDLVPDFVPVAGYADDAILVGLVLGWLLRTRGEDAIRAAWPGPETSLAVVLRLARARGGSA